MMKVGAAKGWKDVPVPAMLAKRPKDRRGYPIPYTATIGAGGEPHFTVIDQQRAFECAGQSKCQLCGEPLADVKGALGGAWLIGGPICFTHPQGAFLDPAMHFECADYAARVCPYIAAPRYRESEALTKRAAEDMGEDMVLVSHEVLETRPEVFLMGQCAAYEVQPTGTGFVVRCVDQEWVRVRGYLHGEVVGSQEELERLLALDSKRHER